VSQRVQSAVAERAVTEEVGELALRGFSRPVRAFSVRGLDAARVTP
jgi:class 3 adenylate cyclase